MLKYLEDPSFNCKSVCLGKLKNNLHSQEVQSYPNLKS